MIIKYILESLGGNDLTRRNYFGYTKNSFHLTALIKHLIKLQSVYNEN
jgi:hypothetical protein